MTYHYFVINRDVADDPDTAGHKPELHHEAKLDRCAGMEFDAIAVNEEGIPYFFKGERWLIREVRLLSLKIKIILYKNKIFFLL